MRPSGRDIPSDDVAAAVYRRAFPDASSHPILLDDPRYQSVLDRLGRQVDTSPRERREFIRSLANFGFTKSMLQVVREKYRSPHAALLFLAHANSLLFDAIDRAASDHRLLRDLAPAEEQHVRGVDRPPAIPKTMEAGFNRALAATDADLAAIDAAILDVTGEPPPKGRAR